MPIHSINAIQNNNRKQSFGARICKNSTVEAYLKYMKEHASETGKHYNTGKQLDLWNKISDAFEKHPSDVEIKPNLIYIKGNLFGSRGVLETKYGSVIDTEPARDDSWAAMENVFKRTLHPDNKEQLNFLLGSKPSVTNKWWNENIKPIWNDIKETFSETTLWSKEEIEKTKDKQWNKAFREQDIKENFRNQPNILVEKFN